ncbi:MAG: GNAT family N-acetyltransferase [Chloroflexota bacterium]|nr:MAG: GNAT family N-acetyltransferase [Chloroflexota bacterium]
MVPFDGASDLRAEPRRAVGGVPPVIRSPERGPERPTLRRPAESDYRGVALVVDDWWDGKVVQGLLPRLWFRHFASTSWLAELANPDGSGVGVAGFLVGFISPEDSAVGVIQAVGVDPRRRRTGIGTSLVEAFAKDAGAAGVRTIETILWPGNRRALPFLAALGFRSDPDLGARPIYGIPSIEGYDFGTEDRARFIRDV